MRLGEDGIDDKDLILGQLEEKKALLAADVSKQIASHFIADDDPLRMKITEEESEVSHYTQDADGKEQRTMVKKSLAGVDDI